MTENLSMDQAFLRKLTDIVLRNIQNERFGVNNLAREAGMSRTTLHRKIKSLKNQDASQFMREIRLRRAMELLHQNAGTTSDIAFMVGFASPNYFNKCFHEFFGYPPGKVKRVAPQAGIETDQNPIKETNESKKPGRRVFIPALLGILVIAIISGLGYAIISKDPFSRKQEKPDNLEKSVAVLPFKNLTDTLSNQYFIDGLMEDVLANLSKIHDLKVISRISTEKFRKTSKSASEIARKLKVNYIVEGSGQKYGNTFRLRIRLIDGRKDSQIWADTYEQEVQQTKDIFRIQNQIAQSIASQLEAKITAGEQQIIEKTSTTSLASFDLYMKANEFRSKFKITHDPKDYRKAVNFYEAAIEIDSSFAKAYTGLASAYYQRYSWEKYFKEGYMDTCLVLINKALKFDNQLDEAFYLKGLYHFANGNMNDALEAFDKALALNPNYYDAYERKGFILVWIIHDYVKGLDSHHKALGLIRGEERSVLLEELGMEYVNIGLLEKARSCFSEAFDLDKNEEAYLYGLAWIEFSQEHLEESWKLFKKVHELDSTYSLIDQIIYCIPPGYEEEAYTQAKRIIRHKKEVGWSFINNSHRIGYALWKAGKFSEAGFYFNQQINYCGESIRLNREYAQRNYAVYDLAATYAFLGNKAKAYHYLEEFDRHKSCQMIVIIVARHDPLFASLRNEERFKKIMQNMEIKYQEEHDRVKKWMEANNML
jgi:TolB-like protein/AraC-like DNA-binding protein/lipopolysaccharide biosynthesis regulator YciM